ncbi:MAG: hypothetical protein NTZ49_04095 [Candidatus Parcubacteria bacterium]|nr:hypothetical protein [Candidatus Parcubacteria bacterium]
MKISEYIKEYTNGNRVKFIHILAECKEFIDDVLRLNKMGMCEEFEDALHFLQLWLYWRFGLNGEIWKITRHSVDKFIGRKSVWNKIYKFVGLPENISGYVGNYNKVFKVVNHLNKFGINKEKAKEAHNKIILGK